MSFDNICKYLAVEYPASFVSWLLNLNTNDIQIPTELKLDPIRADSLILLQANNILYLEFQTLPTSVPSLPLRMLDYWVRLYRQYECPIEQVVIFLKETTSVAAYVEQFSTSNTQHRYRVIRLWEQDPTPLLSNPALLPFAALAQTNSPSALLQQVAARVDMIVEPQQQQNISACIELLASLRFNKNLIRQFLREKLMQESPLYQEIIQEGLQQGLQQGEQRIIMRQLTRRIGQVSPELQAQIQRLTTSQIEELSEALLDFSDSDDLISWLHQAGI